MKSSLAAVGRALLVASLVTAMGFLCPCPASANPAMGDCCESSGLTMMALCCDGANASSTPVAPTATAAAASVTPPVQPLRAMLPDLGLVASAPTFGRPVVARAILRI